MNKMSGWLLAVCLVIDGRVSMAQSSGEDVFSRLPAGCSVTRQVLVPPEQTAAIGRKLGAPLRALTNTFLNVQGQAVQVNILRCETVADATTVHRAIAAMKQHPALCVQSGEQVIEFVGASVPVAVKLAYELGFVAKPRQLVYRVVAPLALVDKADYGSGSELFNLLAQASGRQSSEAAMSRINELAAKFIFGKTIRLRAPANQRHYRFEPVPVAEQQAGQDMVQYSFEPAPQVWGIPAVQLTAEISVNDTGFTPDSRTVEAALLAATPFWPADDPDIAALARQIMAGCSTDAEKVQALVAWLAPGKNIRFGGSVTGSRWGVKQVLAQKYGHCWDFADCFVTLCRVVGIGCRQVGGWLYGVSGHVWAEYLIPGQGWQQVDPTGAGTLSCGIYHISYFTTEDGDMPVLYTSMPEIDILQTAE
ncbi:MAG: transglutaminase-like domain-containing protein [Candidatus Omnitrophica bacterium]|nr:transglutaminase-like domain-containing protein [Candidatus Omnitrophota bacterium]